MKQRKLIPFLLSLGLFVSGSLLGTGMAVAADTTAILPDATVATEATVPVATGVPIATAVTNTGSWTNTDDGRQYVYSDGTLATSTQVIDGIAYLFDDSGIQQTGWQNQNGIWHYYNPQTGAAATGVQKIDGTSYLFDYTGAEKTGWRTVGDVRLYFDPDTGKPVTSTWISYHGGRFYCDATSGKCVGEVTIEDTPYQFDEEGRQCLGFCTFSDASVRYYQENGAPVKGFYSDSATGKSYYFEEDYTMATGWQTLSGSKYYFGTDGGMVTGWQTIAGKTYYFQANGQQTTGLQTVGAATYYFDANGAMTTSWQTIGGSKYYFQSNGTMVTGWQTIGGSKYYFQSSGIMSTGWQTISGSKYYFDSNGKMLTGKQTIAGKVYRFLDSGALKQVKICLDAGHYGKYNPSPVNSAYYESDMSWKLHLYLKSALEAYGIEVITTRANQATDLALEERGKTAAGCDMFLSIHSNACSVSSADGPMACCTITGELNSLGQQLADTIHQVMGTRQGGSIWNRVGLQGNYYGVLRGAAKVGVPGILLEHSYHTNARATSWLLVDSNLEKLAKAEAAVLAAYFGMT